MNTRFLVPGDLDAIHATLTTAFSDYVVRMTPTRDELEEMLRQRSVDYGLSVGAFEGGEMIGVSATGRRDTRAYVISTGVVPGHRGHGVAGRMFELLLPALAARGVESVALEVIRGNDRAIATYRRAGFELVRDLECLTIAREDLVPGATPDDVRIVRREALDREEWSAFWSWRPTWQNELDSVARARGEVAFLEAVCDERSVGYALVLVGADVLAQLAVAPADRRHGVGTALLAEALAAAPALRVLNVDADATADLSFLAARGARPLVGQHEMRRRL